MKNLRLLLALSAMIISSCLFALNPSGTYAQRPEKYNMVAEEVKVKTTDGALLNAWYFPANVKTTQLILISHNGEGNMGDNLRIADQFITMGYNVVMYDYRGFGESSAFAIDNNMYIYPHFQDDLLAMIEYCRTQRVATFSLYGWGMGAGLSLGIGYNRAEVVNIIADTPFLSMEDLESRFAKWDTPMEVPFAGYDRKYEPIYALDNAPAKNIKKIMLIIGSNDILFKTEDMKTLQNKQPKIVFKDIYVVQNPNRISNFNVDRAAYGGAIKTFLEK